MTDERRERILQIAEELENEGLISTNSSFYTRALGHRGDVVKVMKERRAERGGSAVAVADDDDPEDAAEAPAAALEEDLRQLESAYEGWHVSLEAIWQLETEGPLSEANFSRARWLEYQCTENLKQQERVRPQLEQARTREAVRAAQAQHDALIPEVTALAAQVEQAVAALTAALAALVAGFEAQSDPFFPFRSRDGHQAFDVLGGREEVINFVGRLFPQDYRSADLVRLLLDNRVTQGRAREALDASPRLHVFPPRIIDRYLTEMEGMTHASNP